MDKYLLEKSRETPGRWVLTDTENLVVIRFKQHHFNDTQKVSVLNESPLVSDPNCANKLAHIMSAMADYMAANHHHIAMPFPVFRTVKSQPGDHLSMQRCKFPHFTLHVHDQCTPKQLADALKAMAEHIIRKR